MQNTGQDTAETRAPTLEDFERNATRELSILDDHLRGETTTIVDPVVALGLDEESIGRRIVVLSEFDRTGLLIDHVHQVLDVEDQEVDTSSATGSTRGVVRRDDRFVVWVEPAALV